MLFRNAKAIRPGDYIQESDGSTSKVVSIIINTKETIVFGIEYLNERGQLIYGKKRVYNNTPVAIVQKHNETTIAV